MTVHISQHFHHSEVMEEVEDNEIEKHQLLVACVSQQLRGGNREYRETDQPVTHTNKLLTQLCWTDDYTSGHQNLEKMMLDN